MGTELAIGLIALISALGVALVNGIVYVMGRFIRPRPVISEVSPEVLDAINRVTMAVQDLTAEYRRSHENLVRDLATLLERVRRP